tara:strand:- start:317 stop:970 length:654 start_codon:yes stop_codon:yes gene_type:complete
MALSKVNFNSLNVTPSASKALKFNSNNNGLETGDVGGSLVLISETTASNSSAVNFTSGLDSTYKEYQFHFTDIHPASGNSAFMFNLSADGGSNYNVTKTTTAFWAAHNEAGSDSNLYYRTSEDLAQSTADQKLSVEVTFPASVDDDNSFSGILHLFDPSSTTFVKHFISDGNHYASNYSTRSFVAGYGNTTSAINAITFKMSTGNIATGTIKMYGVV